MPPSVVWALSIIEVFFLSLSLAPSVGCDPSQGYLSQEKHKAQKGTANDIF
jgi:hypothetical protein